MPETNPYNTTILSSQMASPAEDWFDMLREFLQKKNPTYKEYVNKLPWWAIEEMEQTPTTGYAPFSAIQGHGGSTNYKTWLDKQYSEYYKQYKSAGLANPALWWTQFLGILNPRYDFAMTAPYERNERPATFAPSMRMVW